MGQWAIEAEGLSKSYRKGVYFETLRHQLTRRLGQLIAPRDARQESANRFLALDDVSFSLPKGEVLGLVGHNGAGKSTLLKILSRITTPDKGWAKIEGRMASLLEVGTGFHPELTGRENIFLNGSILGMKRAEVRQRIDQIVDFSEVGSFLDTPVKHYSSGMYVRLAFSVAAHIEPEILIIDEVLAVGDLAFQRKCLGKMQDAARGGQTVIIVSHNLSVVHSLCTRCLLLVKGKSVAEGSPQEVIDLYLNDSSAQSDSHRLWSPPLTDVGVAWLHEARICDAAGQGIKLVQREQGCWIELIYEVRKAAESPGPRIELRSSQGELIAVLKPEAERVRKLMGMLRVAVEIPANLLRSGLYRIGVSVQRMVPPLGFFVRVDNALLLEVVENMEDVQDESQGIGQGLLRPEWPWRVSHEGRQE